MEKPFQLKIFEKFLKEKGIAYKVDEPLAKHTTIRIGGPASFMVFPKKEDELLEIVKNVTELDIPWYVVGGGSNLLCADEGYPGVVINLRSMKGIAERSLVPDANLFLEVLSGTMVGEVISFARRKGYSGLEFLAGVPATVGGAVRMNAGAYGRSFSMLVRRVKLLINGKIEDYEPNDSDWTYRSFRKEGIVVSATLELVKSNPEEIERKLKEIYFKRKASQPLAQKTFGSAFKNPPCCYAGKLIEDCGLKGFRVGGAKVSEKHANFIVNLGSATAKDVLALLREVQKRVWERFSIMLEPEVKFLGCSM
ncbi:MAG: UDP-N-acetylmuramate dehydrogenase [Thermodesulfobacterium sp.]|nr:UDP-N-acetylmuramate dehydrogenase [Thermodesulfobacterium sp.]